ncbi:MAG: methionyl-tRNA formyltransferase [Candidatus Magasanikbacteria bacterium]|nr:methionyl-tRNA formyltransferase [Candidatus Magasanikbacteria bacterium]
MKIIFFGTNTLATAILHALTQESTFEICAVVTQPDKPAGRGYKAESPLIKRFAENARLTVLQYKKLNDEAVTALRAYNADVFIVAEYGVLIPEMVLSIPRHGTLNVHPSLLPNYRGASPIQSAILAGDTQTGVTIMLLDKEMDHGPILTQEACEIDKNDTAVTLEATLGRLGSHLLIDTLPRWIAGSIQPREQDHTRATFCKKLTRESGRIDWTQSAEYIYRMWRAYLPWPGIFTMWNGKRLKMTSIAPRNGSHPERAKPRKFYGAKRVEGSHEILRPTSRPQNDVEPGIPFLTPDKNLAIACDTGAIIVERLQLEGKKELDTDAFLRGYSKFLHSRLT